MEEQTENFLQSLDGQSSFESNPEVTGDKLDGPSSSISLHSPRPRYAGREVIMKMDGYDIIPNDFYFRGRRYAKGRIYQVYTLDGGKHYHYGYASYKDMIAAHPELK